MSEHRLTRADTIASDSAFADLWVTARSRASGFKDKLGRGMDPGIIDTVTAFLLLGFGTLSSCEGHPERPRTAPKISLFFPEPVIIKPELDRDALLAARAPIEALLGAFNHERPAGPQRIAAVSLTSQDTFIGVIVASESYRPNYDGASTCTLVDQQQEMLSLTDFMVERALSQFLATEPADRRPFRLKSVDVHE